MTLDEFPLLQDNTRLLRHKDVLYKVKAKYEKHTATNINRKKAHTQIEDTFRALLYIIQREDALNLKPISTEDFFITILTAPWTFCERYGFTQNGKELKAYPLQFEFRIKVKENSQHDKVLNGESYSGSISPTHKVTKDVCDTYEGNATRVLTRSTGSVRRFTRSKQGSLLHDGKKVMSVDNVKQDTVETESPGVSEKIMRTQSRPNESKVPKSFSAKRKGRLIGKLQSEDEPPSKRQNSESGGDILREADKGLEVERFHNRNNSNFPISVYSGHDLRDRGGRKWSSNNENLHRRHSERLRSKENLQFQDSAFARSSSENRYKLRKHKRHIPDISVENSACTKDKPNFNREIVSRDHNIDNDRTKNAEIHKLDKVERKPKTMQKDDSDCLHVSNEDRMTRPEDERKQNRVINAEQDRKPAEINETKESGLRNVKSSAANSQETRAKKHKLYTEKESQLLIPKQEIRSKGQTVNSPRISTVLPQKRARPQHDLQSPRLTRHGALGRSPMTQTDLITSSGPSSHRNALDEESQRIQRMRHQGPTHAYRDILLAQGRDRHMVEQAERAETDKLQQLYEPTAVRRSPRLQERGKDSSLWQKFVGTILTPVKNIMTGSNVR